MIYPFLGGCLRYAAHPAPIFLLPAVMARPRDGNRPHSDPCRPANPPINDDVRRPPLADARFFPVPSPTSCEAELLRIETSPQ